MSGTRKQNKASKIIHQFNKHTPSDELYQSTTIPTAYRTNNNNTKPTHSRYNVTNT